MKKLILTFSVILISICAFAQPVGIKLKTAETFTVVPAQTADADSLFSTVHDMGTYLYVDITFYRSAKPVSGMKLTLWNGVEYKENENWTNETVIGRIKELLEIQK